MATKKAFEKVTCEKCVFWERLSPRNGDVSGFCFRYPPTVVKIDCDEYDTRTPETSPVDWCGEGRAK